MNFCGYITGVNKQESNSKEVHHEKDILYCCYSRCCYRFCRRWFDKLTNRFSKSDNGQELDSFRGCWCYGSRL